MYFSFFLSFFLSDVQGLPGDFGKPGHPGEPGLPVSIWIMSSSWYSVYTRRWFKSGLN